MMITNDWLLHENDYALAHLETYYQDILTRLGEEEIAMTKSNCLDISRKIKAVKETLVLLGIDLD